MSYMSWIVLEVLRTASRTWQQSQWPVHEAVGVLAVLRLEQQCELIQPRETIDPTARVALIERSERVCERVRFAREARANPRQEQFVAAVFVRDAQRAPDEA